MNEVEKVYIKMYEHNTPHNVLYIGATPNHCRQVQQELRELMSTRGKVVTGMTADKIETSSGTSILFKHANVVYAEQYRGLSLQEVIIGEGALVNDEELAAIYAVIREKPKKPIQNRHLPKTKKKPPVSNAKIVTKTKRYIPPA
jgi:hypothetical protein